MPDSRPLLSAILITQDAAAQLPACLDSLAFCDEIIVVDSGSRDATVALAQSRGARVIHAEWRGFGLQKQFAVAQATHDWVLCIDADERVSERLQKEILRALATGNTQAFRFARCNRFLGRYLRHGEGYPDWSLRLFDRRHAHWSDDVVHEKVLIDNATLPATLTGDLLHDSAETLDAYLAKQNRYTTLAAEQAVAQGKRSSFVQMLLSPWLRFIKFYFLRLGFLDGLPGLVHILIGCSNSFIKHAKIRDIQNHQRLSDNP